MDLKEDSNVDIVDTLFIRKASYLTFEVAMGEEEDKDDTDIPEPALCHSHKVFEVTKHNNVLSSTH